MIHSKIACSRESANTTAEGSGDVGAGLGAVVWGVSA